MRRFETLQTELAAHGVSLVALSKDSTEDAASYKKRDGLTFTVLCDPKLDVIRQYGVEHHKAVEASSLRFTVFGVPLALVLTFKTMAIPTTLLVNEAGIVRWIDQADDYRIRSSGRRVMEAVHTAFTAPPAR